MQMYVTESLCGKIFFPQMSIFCFFQKFLKKHLSSKLKAFSIANCTTLVVKPVTPEIYFSAVAVTVVCKPCSVCTHMCASMWHKNRPN